MSFLTLHPFGAFPLPSERPGVPPVSHAVSPPAPVPRPYMVPTAIAHSPTLSTANPALLAIRNPIFGIWTLGQAQPRSSFSLPVLISPVAQPTDATLFEEPADPTKKHFLRHYALATQGSGGGAAYCVSFSAGADGFDLSVQLSDVTDPALAQDATPIDPSATRYFLTANLDGQAASWDFGSATPDDSNLKLSLTVTDPAARDSIYRAMTDPTAHAQLVIRRSFPVAVPASPPPATSQQMYRENLTAIDSTIAFTFDPVLDKNVFAGLGSVGSGQPSWGVTLVEYAPDNRSFPYYQDARQPTQIYYLPDTFSISRSRTAPHAPNITIASNGNDPDTITFTLSVLAVPTWNPDRIAAAAKWWQQNLQAQTLPTMSLFEASNAQLQLTVPAAGSGAPVLTQQSSAVIDITSGISCSVTLTLAQLQEVYAAFFDQVSQLLTGVVTVTVGSDTESIDFSWRASDFIGSVLDTTTTFDATQSAFKVTVTNGCESPVHVDSLPAEMMKGPIDPTSGRPSTKVPDAGQQIVPPPPVDLAPATAPPANPPAPSSLEIDIQLLPTTLAGLGNIVSGGSLGSLGSILGGLVTNAASAGEDAQSGAPTVVLDFSHTIVKPDPSAMWDAIMSNQVVAPIQRSIKVIAFASMFATSGTTPIAAAQVVFENGQTLDFDSSTPADSSGLMTQTIVLAVPIKEYVLQSGDTSIYRYRINLVRATGTQQGDWISSNTDSFYVQTGG